MQDPLISADVAHSIVIKLQTYITHYRTQKAKKDLEFTEKVLKESRSAYYKAQQAYAAFEDGNKNIISASYRTEQERLRNEMTLTFNVYNTLAQKLEQDKLRVQEQTPVYTIIEPAQSFLSQEIVDSGSIHLPRFHRGMRISDHQGICNPPIAEI